MLRLWDSHKDLGVSHLSVAILSRGISIKKHPLSTKSEESRDRTGAVLNHQYEANSYRYTYKMRGVLL